MMLRHTALTALTALAVAVPAALAPAAASEDHEPEHEHAREAAAGHEEHHHETAMTGGRAAARDQAVRVLLLQAHLRAGKEFYDAGDKQAAVQHFRHFVGELKGEAGHALAAHGFARGHVLEEAEDALVDAVVEDQPRPVVVSVYRHTMFEMDRQLTKVGALRLRDPDFVLGVCDTLLQRAGRHYAAGVRGEQLSKPSEYRYARSIGEVARNFVGRVAADLRTRDQQAFRQLVRAFDRLNATMARRRPDAGTVASAQTLRSRLGQVQVAARNL
jgi:hypothetical protein